MSEPQKILYEGKNFYIQREGNQIVAITRLSATEYSRLDVQAKRATHWYARTICDFVYKQYKNKEEPLKILCLGSAMGALPYELLSEYKNAIVTCVDIDWESIYILEKSILKEFENRVEYFTGDAREFLQESDTEEFDIIINDLFTEQDSPPFIHSQTFLRSLFRSLKHHGFYFANTISDAFVMTHGIAIEKIGYSFERFLRNKGKTNIVYVSKKD